MQDWIAVALLLEPIAGLAARPRKQMIASDSPGLLIVPPPRKAMAGRHTVCGAALRSSSPPSDGPAAASYALSL